jgi:Transglycosylase-like domain
VRIRIALTTAIAVIAGMTTGIFTLSMSHQPASAQAATHHPSHTTSTTVLSHTALSAFAISKAVAPTTSTTLTAPPTSTTTSTTTPPAAPIVTTPATTPTTTPPVTAPPVTDATSVDTANWACIRVHESGDQYNSPAAPSGAYGILISTWRSFGYSGWPYEAPASVQDHVALELYARFGWEPWSSRFACGL